MYLADLLEKANISQAEASRILDTSPVSISKRCNRNSEVKVSELLKFEKATNKLLLEEHVSSMLKNKKNEYVEISYYTHPNLKTDIKKDYITSIWFDRELVENEWKRIPEKLRIIKMLGDKMEGGHYPLLDGDILIFDTSETDVVSSGVYVYTMRNGEDIYINNVSKGMDGFYKFFCTNTKYQTKKYTFDELEKMGFNVVGKVVKNLSMTI